MKNSIFILLFCSISILGKAQNLVPNYSFEYYTTCPTASGQITYASPWYGVTSGGTTDYFNTCFISYQTPRTGNGYAGIWVFSAGPNLREYLQVQLATPLSTGSCYFVEYYVNLSNTMMYALSSIDAYFSTTAIDSTGTGYVLNLTPQIKKYSSSAINDTVLWTKISGIYIASGGENYITIGNYFDDINIDTINTGYSYYGSYYYIDDVSVVPIDSIVGAMPANAGNNVTIISGDSTFIGQEITNLNCNWYIGTTLIADSISGIFVSPTSTTSYIVVQNLCGNITYDTVTVYVSGVGIYESDWSKKINIYPNPSIGEFILDLSETKSAQWNVFIADVQGREIFRQVFNNNNDIRLKLEAENGLYLIHITNTLTNETSVKKMIIQK